MTVARNIDFLNGDDNLDRNFIVDGGRNGGWIWILHLNEIVLSFDRSCSSSTLWNFNQSLSIL